MMMKEDGVENLNLEGLARMLNFHGTQMLQEMCNKASTQKLGFVDIYQQLIRTHQVDFKEMKQRMQKYRPNQSETDFFAALRSFLLEELKILFAAVPVKDHPPETALLKSSSLSSSLLSAGCVPSFESFLDLSVREEKEKFFKDCGPGQVVHAEIRSRDESGLTVKVLCTDKGYERILQPLQIEVFIPRDDVIGAEGSDLELQKYNRGQFIRAVVLSVLPDSQLLNLSLTASPGEKLGLVTEDELPSFYACSASGSERNYDKKLRRTEGFRNPTVEESLCSELGLENRGSYWSTSLLSRIRSESNLADQAEHAAELRKVQTHKMSMKSVVKGVEKFKTGDNVSAMHHLNKALEIEERNAEALVARGALYANQESFDLAIKDFRAALLEDAGHENARKYLLETLLAKARTYESKRKEGVSRTAMDCYKEVLVLSPHHHDAEFRLNKLTEELKSRSWVHRKTRGEKRKRPDSDESDSSDQSTEADAPSHSKRENGSRRNPNSDLASSVPDDELTKRLREYYEKYNHRNLSAEQQKELSESGLMDKLKEYYDQYQRRNSRGDSTTRVILDSDSSNSDEIQILESPGTSKNRKIERRSEPAGRPSKSVINQTMAQERTGKRLSMEGRIQTQASNAESNQKGSTQNPQAKQDSIKLKKMEDFISQLKKKKPT